MAWRAKAGRGHGLRGVSLLRQLQEIQPSSIPRLVGHPLSADEYFLSAMAMREDSQTHADDNNFLTFGEAAGWAADDMLAAHDGHAAKIGVPGDGECLVGTCGFMGVAAGKYAAKLKAVELNATFHDQGDASYEAQAANYAKLGVRVVVKVSGYATHRVSLQDPTEWWPWLRTKYAPFVNEGVLVGLLWQLPPSFTCTEEHCQRLDMLGELLRSKSQTDPWLELRHAFEFRHSSWFQSSAPLEHCFRKHGLTRVSLHVVNDTAWAGDLESGWHGLPEEGATSSFVYLRCFGTRGRSIGRYKRELLQDMVAVTEKSNSSVVMFGQGDAPKQALGDAWELQDLLKDPTLPSAEEPRSCLVGQVLTGVVLRKEGDRSVLSVTLDGTIRTGFLGSRHSGRRGLKLRKGERFENLRVEAEDDLGRLLLSVCDIRGPKEGPDHAEKT